MGSRFQNSRRSSIAWGLLSVTPWEVFAMRQFCISRHFGVQALQSLGRQNGLVTVSDRSHHTSIAAFSAQGFNALELMKGIRLAGHYGHFLVSLAASSSELSVRQ